MYPMLEVATVTVYSGGYIFLVFLSVCLGISKASRSSCGVCVSATSCACALPAATGLYYLAELIEEYTKLAKRIITYTIQAILVLHILLFVIDRLPAKCIAAGLAANACHLGQMKRFPFMELWSPVTLGSIGTYTSVAANAPNNSLLGIAA